MILREISVYVYNVSTTVNIHIASEKYDVNIHSRHIKL